MQISREDYDKVREEKKQIRKCFQEEMLFDQLATTVIEWHEAMVKFAARADAASFSYPTILKNIRECNLMLRIANVLSMALSFTENVEDDHRHKEHECGQRNCTIAIELRNRIQHDWLIPQQLGRWTNMRLTTPQMDKMPANFTRNSVVLSVPWQQVRDEIIGQRKGTVRAERFEQACKQEFPNLDSVDMVIVINAYLRCLSNVMEKRRSAQPLDEYLRTHAELLEQSAALNERDVVSPEGEKIHLEGISQMLRAEIKELLDRNQRLPNLELIQFGDGSPTQARRHTNQQ